MKTAASFVILAALLAALGSAAEPPQRSASCWDTATAQDALNDCAKQESDEADGEMNKIYRRILAKYESDSVFIDRLKAAQRAWLAYRDAHVESWYPDVTNRWQSYGSVRPMCTGLIRARLTRERTALLREMLNPEEGETCALPLLSDPGGL